jgi:hypothetical protein
VRQDIGKDVEAEKNKIDRKRTIQQLLLLSFPILRSEFRRYRQNPNGTLKKLFQFEPGANPDFSPDISDQTVGSFEINSV